MISSIFVAAFLMVSVFGQNNPHPSGFCPCDICLIIDTSDSIEDDTLSDLFQTLGQFAGQLDVGTVDNQVLVAVVTFGEEAENPIGFYNYTNNTSLAMAIKDLSRVASSRGTKTSKALDKCGELFQNSRSDCDDLIILVTDGTSGEGDILTAAIERVKAENITVIAIGIATKIRKQNKLEEVNQQLLEIACNKSENTRSFNSTSLDQLDNFLTEKIGNELQKCTCQNDIIFVLDYSKTIDDDEFDQIRKIASDIVMGVDDVGQSVRFCILVYGYGAVLEAHLNDSYNKTTLLAEIAAIKRLQQFRGTRTINALREAANVFMSEGKPDAKQSIILITDGRATDDKGQRLSRARTLLNQKEINIWGIGVGNKINGTELERIVGDPTKVILDFSSDDLEQVVEEIEACP